MSDNPATVLKLLFGITQKQIDLDLAEGEKDFQRLMEDSDNYLPDVNHTAEEEARHHHIQMIRAKVMQSRKNLQEEMKLYFAAMAVHNVAEDAVSVADERGRLAELGNRMAEIQKREGLPDDELWLEGEGPEDFQQLYSESEELFAKVYDSVFTTILQRYRLDDIVDLYENNRELFEEMWERGRNMIFESSSDK